MERDGNTSYVEAGRVNGTTMEFVLNGERFRIESAEAIAAGRERPLFVLHEPEVREGDAPALGSAGHP